MKILSHRGYWLDPAEKNTSTSFERSFSLGFGTETDIRDAAGQLVISHDMPSGREQTLAQFLSCADRHHAPHRVTTLALNIKACGLAHEVSAHLSVHPQLDCFVFDMAIPDVRPYIQLDIPIFTRMSELEPNPLFLQQAAGVWLDALTTEWYDNTVILKLLDRNKRVCIVSPELHGRPHQKLWEMLHALPDYPGQIMLCTDQPVSASAFFSGVTT
jgi:hypothetical protein